MAMYKRPCNNGINSDDYSVSYHQVSLQNRPVTQYGLLVSCNYKTQADVFTSKLTDKKLSANIEKYEPNNTAAKYIVSSQKNMCFSSIIAENKRS